MVRLQEATANDRRFRLLPMSCNESSIAIGSVQISRSASVMIVSMKTRDRQRRRYTFEADFTSFADRKPAASATARYSFTFREKER
jgi:hypothetical protein